MKKTDEILNAIVIDDKKAIDVARPYTDELSLKFERDARRYNRAFSEEQEVGVG